MRGCLFQCCQPVCLCTVRPAKGKDSGIFEAFPSINTIQRDYVLLRSYILQLPPTSAPLLIRFILAQKSAAPRSSCHPLRRPQRLRRPSAAAASTSWSKSGPAEVMEVAHHE